MARLDNSKVKLRIGAVYAPQESRTSKEVLTQMYENIEEQVGITKGRQQSLLKVGDLNCIIGEKIEGNTKEITKGGRLLKDMVKRNKLTILNASEKCDGVWTRVEGHSKSVLDYVIVNDESIGGFLRMKIDEQHEYAPRSIGSSNESDHTGYDNICKELVECKSIRNYS